MHCTFAVKYFKQGKLPVLVYISKVQANDIVSYHCIVSIVLSVIVLVRCLCVIIS